MNCPSDGRSFGGSCPDEARLADGSGGSVKAPRWGTKVPVGWRFVTRTTCGAPVFTPECPKRRREIFHDCIAFVDEGAVWVRSKTAWLRDRKLRRHEETHLRHIAWLGERRFWRWYRAFSVLGYWLNPFEIAARAAEER
jgi:hypothetical protein